jgi:PIN like domain
VPHPAGLPDLFLDRSLGRIQVPTLLRNEGIRLVTLAERYGIPNDEQVSDEQWLKDAGERGEAAFMKDGRIRYNAPEKAAIIRHRVRCFCITRGDLAAQAMARRFLDNLERIEAACADDGPFVYAVHERRIELLEL